MKKKKKTYQSGSFMSPISSTFRYVRIPKEMLKTGRPLNLSWLKADSPAQLSNPSAGAPVQIPKWLTLILPCLLKESRLVYNFSFLRLNPCLARQLDGTLLFHSFPNDTARYSNTARPVIWKELSLINKNISLYVTSKCHVIRPFRTRSLKYKGLRKYFISDIKYYVILYCDQIQNVTKILLVNY